MAAETPTTETERDPVLDQSSCYCDLHVHSEYSSLDGGAKVKDMPAKMKELGRGAMGLTDHGVMQGLPEFYDTLKKAGVKPILGMEAYLTDDRFSNLEDKTGRKSPTWHLTLLAETTEGYKNLCKLSSWAFIEGTIITFGRPRARADWELLKRYSKGVIALTGCMAAPVMSEIFKGSISQARRNAERLKEIFGQQNLYGELQNVGIVGGVAADSEAAEALRKAGRGPTKGEPATRELAKKHPEWELDFEKGNVVPLSQTDANWILVEFICKPLGLRYVWTGDSHYLNADDAQPHDAMLCIGTGQTQKGQRRFSLLPKRYHVRSDEELRELNKEWPEALEETKQVALRCNAEIEYGRELLPRFPLPEGFAKSGDYLRHLCVEGLEERYEKGTERYKEAVARLEMELGVIGSMGFNDYFLIVWDLFAEAKRRGILSGPGRGSAAGAIVAFCLGITQLCPLEYGLLFERFLNPGRRSMPDIDMDFPQRHLEEMKQYAREKYNGLAGCETAVAQIVTYGKFKAKGALRDAARVLATPTDEGKAEALALGNRLSKLIPDDPKATMRSVWEDKIEGEALRRAFKAGGLAAEVIKLAGWLEGFVRTNGLHAAAVVIGDHDLTEDLPLQKFDKDKPLHTQYDMGYAEKLGLLKMDFLGLRNLDIIADTLKKLPHTRGITINDPYRDIPLDDLKTYELFARGESVGTFQFESGGMQGALKEVRPSEFRDLIALVALYRPGPMQNIPVYAARKHGREPVSYPEMKDELIEVLSGVQGETYGITVYQEQSMLIARGLSGFSPAEADDLRKAIGKKLRDKMEALKKPFMEGAVKAGVPKEVAAALWDDNERSADYSFNKSHAACYGFLSYITGFLKANYPHEYMASLLTSVMSDKDKPRLYLTEAKRMGLRVLPPDINRSLNDFAVLEVEDHPGEFEILFGLTALRGVGSGIVSEIRRERENGPFTSMFDLIRRMPHLTKTVLHALVKGGALDSTGATRKAMFEEVEIALQRIRKEYSDREKEFVKAIIARVEQSGADDGQDSLFGESKAGKKTNKLASTFKKGVEGAAKLAWAEKGAPDQPLVLGAIEDAIEKERLRVARAEVRKVFKERESLRDDNIAGIANEEGGENSEKEQIEALAQAQLQDQRTEIRSEADALLARTYTALVQEFEERAETEMLDAALEAEADPVLSSEEWSDTEKLRLERKTLGTYVTGHPLEADARTWARYVDKGLGHVTDELIGKTIKVVGAIVGIQEKKIRGDEIMRIVALEDLTGSREITIFQRTLEGGLEALIEEDAVVCVEVAVQEDTFTRNRDDAGENEEHEDENAEKPVKMTASRIYRWDPSRVSEEAARKPINVEIGLEHFNREWVGRLRAICSEHPGEHPVRLILEEQDGTRKPHRTELRVEPTPELLQAIKNLLGSSGGHEAAEATPAA